MFVRPYVRQYTTRKNLIASFVPLNQNGGVGSTVQTSIVIEIFFKDYFRYAVVKGKSKSLTSRIPTFAQKFNGRRDNFFV